MTTLQKHIALSLFNGIGAINARKLVAYLGSVDHVFNASRKEIREIPGLGDKVFQLLIDSREAALEQATKELAFIEKHEIETFFYLDENYPKRLTQCADAPVILYKKGGT